MWAYFYIYVIQENIFENCLNYPSKSQKNYKCCLDKSVEAVLPKDKTRKCKI